MAEYFDVILNLGLFLFNIKDVLAEYSCTYDCSGYTCITYCDHGCCGTYDNRYCCSAYTGVATIIGAVIGGLIALGVVIAVIVFCVMAIQKKKRSVHPRTVQPVTHNTVTVNNNRSYRPARPVAAPPYSTGHAAPPPSYNDIYPQYNTNNSGYTTQSTYPANTMQADFPSTNNQSNQQYGQSRLPNSPPPAYI